MDKRGTVGKRYSLRLRAKRNASAPSSMQFDDMNDDCLEHIFSFLDVNDLMKVCRVGRRVKNIVINRVIPLKTVDFADVSSVRRVFALFGASMTRIIVHSDDMQTDEYPANSQLNEFLRLVVAFGVPGRLQQVNFTFGGNEHGIPIDILSVIGPFFENVHTLSFFLLNDHMQFFHQFMQTIPKHNLCSLSLHRVQVLGDWLVAEKLPNLRKIHLCIRWGLHTSMENRLKIEALNETRLIEFISKQLGALVDLDYDCSTQNRIFTEMSQHMPNIEHLGTLMWWPSVHELGNNNEHWAISQMYRNKWKYLNAYKNLKCVSLVSYATDGSDLGEVFRILAAQNTICHMKLSLGWYGSNDRNSVIAVNDLRRLFQLKTLDLNFFFLQNEFLFKLFENLPALTKCTIKSFNMTEAFISNVVRLARKLTVLVIYNKFDLFSAKFYKNLLKIRKMVNDENDVEQRLTIYFSRISIQHYIDRLGANYEPAIIALKTIDFHSHFC